MKGSNFHYRMTVNFAGMRVSTKADQRLKDIIRNASFQLSEAQSVHLLSLMQSFCARLTQEQISIKTSVRTHERIIMTRMKTEVHTVIQLHLFTARPASLETILTHKVLPELELSCFPNLLTVSSF
mmetsp:Transcript_2098/g.3010  ORF Transcript_2098/g.3010 Transcript_2098/m.3010 type:complete len:126 (+) Transcript_2098:550-927(+)